MTWSQAGFMELQWPHQGARNLINAFFFGLTNFGKLSALRLKAALATFKVTKNNIGTSFMINLGTNHHAVSSVRVTTAKIRNTDNTDTLATQKESIRKIVAKLCPPI